MTEDEKGGSKEGKGAADSSGQGAELTNKIAKMSNDQLRAEYVAIKQQDEKKDGMIADLTKQLKEANDVLEGQEKQKFIGEILPRARFKTEDLASMSVPELKNIRATLDQAVLPQVNSVRFGVPCLDDRADNLTVGDQSVVTARRRKQGAA